MPKRTVRTLKYKPVSPLPSELEVIYYKCYSDRLFSQTVALKMLKTNKLYLHYMFRSPSDFRVFHLVILAGLCKIDVYDAFRMSMVKCENFARLKVWAEQLVWSEVSGVRLPGVRKNNEKRVKRKANELYRLSCSYLKAA